MWPEVARQKGTEQQSEVIYLCSHSCQRDEKVFFSSNIWHVRAPGVLLTNNQAVVLAAQHVRLEPFRETVGVLYTLLSILSRVQLPR